jgi:nucleoside phosphorylase
MEGAALFALLGDAGVRCAEIRAVSNYVGEEFAKWSVEEATENLAKTLKSIFDE